MSDLFVPYEIALIAKEKGFAELCYMTYNPCVRVWHQQGTGLIGEGNLRDKQVLAPMYQQLVDWFREKHNLAIIISIPFDVFWIYSIDGINGNGYYTDSTYKDKTDFSDYYEALNEALKEAFKLIK